MDVILLYFYFFLNQWPVSNPSNFFFFYFFYVFLLFKGLQMYHFFPIDPLHSAPVASLPRPSPHYSLCIKTVSTIALFYSVDFLKFRVHIFFKCIRALVHMNFQICFLPFHIHRQKNKLRWWNRVRKGTPWQGFLDWLEDRWQSKLRCTQAGD